MSKFTRFVMCVGVVMLLTMSAVLTSRAHAADKLDVASLLNADGTLDLSKGASGSLELNGWNVRLDAVRGPMLEPVRQTPNAPFTVDWNPVKFGVNDNVYIVVLSGADVYVGGVFTEICGNAACDSGNTSANRIAKWDGAAWSTLGYGLDGFVSAIVFSGTDMYVGGVFTEICGNAACNSGNTSAKHIAKWDGLTWAAVGNGVNGNVYAIRVSGTDLYVGGGFTQICGNVACDSGNTTVNYIAKWSGSAWSTLGYGVSNTVEAIVFSGTDVYVGGAYLDVCGNAACNSGNTTVNHIAKWNGSTWSAVGNGVDDTVWSITVSGTDVYAGGSFAQVCGNTACDTGNTTVHQIAKWNGATWSALGNGVNSTVLAVTVSGTDVYVVGKFTEVCGNPTCDSGNTTVNYIAKWNSSAWSAIGSGMGFWVLGITFKGTDMYIGGSFTNTATASCASCRYLARYGNTPTAVTLSQFNAKPGFDLGAWFRQMLGLGK